MNLLVAVVSFSRLNRCELDNNGIADILTGRVLGVDKHNLGILRPINRVRI